MKLFSYILPIISILILSLFWIIIQLDVKFSFGAEQPEYIFTKGQELGTKANWFVLSLIILNIIMLGVTFFTRKNNS